MPRRRLALPKRPPGPAPCADVRSHDLAEPHVRRYVWSDSWWYLMRCNRCGVRVWSRSERPSDTYAARRNVAEVA